MLLRPFLNDASSCASYLFGCGTHSKLAVVDPHVDLVDDYLSAAAADRRRGEEPWLVFSGDSLLIGDVGRPDLHVAGDADGQARRLHASLRRLLELPDHVVLYPSHYAGSLCGRGLSGNPVSSIGFERAHNPLLALADPASFAEALLADSPPPPAEQERIVAANRSGRVGAPA